ncbi:hypothetical protein ACPPVO_35230 [Dactylosporangium sp. McL0621]|uniref:hypothetical protein n=1 Tax=Dactylosporangium sp. McL0621 TaxID=3415678 RepID=UPI003CE9CA73
MNGHQAAIAAAVEQQTATTGDMRHSAADASGDIAATINTIADAASATQHEVIASQAVIATVNRMSDDLRHAIGQFRYAGAPHPASAVRGSGPPMDDVAVGVGLGGLEDQLVGLEQRPRETSNSWNLVRFDRGAQSGGPGDLRHGLALVVRPGSPARRGRRNAWGTVGADHGRMALPLSRSACAWAYWAGGASARAWHSGHTRS